MKVHAAMRQVRWLVLDELLKAGTQFHNQLQANLRWRPRGWRLHPPVCCRHGAVRPARAPGCRALFGLDPRESNKEAVRLADGNSAAFAPEMRAHAAMRQVRWLVLEDLLTSGSRFYKQMQAKKAARATGKQRAKEQPAPKRQELRDRDPW